MMNETVQVLQNTGYVGMWYILNIPFPKKNQEIPQKFTYHTYRFKYLQLSFLFSKESALISASSP